MNLDQLQKTLIAAARAHPPQADVPYGFAQRMRAQLQAQRRPDSRALWGQALWRAAAPCVCIVLLLGAWTLLAPPSNGTAGDLSQELENTVLAAVNQEQLIDSN